MVTKQILLNNLNTYIGSSKVLIYDQNTTDIIKELLKAHKDNEQEYNKIYKYFNFADKNKIFENIFNFCKKNIKYKIESGEKQTLKTPTAILIQGYGDCKQYAQFIGGVLDAINRNGKKIDWCYRFASYNNQKKIQHVFVVVKTKEGEIWIDPVLPYYNDKKQYSYKIDKKMLYSISGFDDLDELGATKRKPAPKKKIQVKKGSKLVVPKSVIDKVRVANKRVPIEKLTTKLIAQAKKDGKFVAIKSPSAPAGKKRKKGFLKKISIKSVAKAGTAIKKVALKVGLAPARNAFLLLVSLNILGLGKKLALGIQRGAKILKTWENLGGAPSKLKSAISKGSKTKIAGVEDFDNEIGAVTFAATIAAATPIILKLTSILKAVGINPDELVAKGKQAILDKVKSKLTKGQTRNDAEVDQTSTNDAGIETQIKDENGGTSTKSGSYSMTMKETNQPDTDAETDGTDGTTEKTTSEGMDYKKLIIPAVVVAGLYLLTKKK